MPGFEGMFLSAPDTEIFCLDILRPMTLVANMGILDAVCAPAADFLLSKLLLLQLNV